MKWLADENFRGAIVRGAVRRNPVLDIVRAQDVPEISGADDFAMLRWAAGQNRVVLTHDLSTMVPAIHEIAQEGLMRARVVLVPDSVPVARAIDDLLLLDECSVDTDWAAGILYLPLS